MPLRGKTVTILIVLAPLFAAALIFGIVVFQAERTPNDSTALTASSSPTSAGPSSAVKLASADLSNLVLPEEVKLPDQTIPLTWTDADQSNENLLIKSDRKYYDGSGQTDVYFSLTNASGKDQKAAIVFWFDCSAEKVGKMEKIENGQISNSQFLISNKFSIPNVQNRKDIKGYTQGNEFADAIPAGQTTYYKASISYPANQKQTEFFIEGFGDQGGYGHLDPYLASGLVGYWSFNGADINSLTNIAYDRSGQANDGAISGAIPAIGISGQALSFNGVDDYVNLGTPSSLNLSDNFSISAWVKVAGWGISDQPPGIVERGPANTGGIPTIALRADLANCADQSHGFTFRIYDGINNAENIACDKSTGTWYHLVMVVGPRGPGGLKGYVNGVQEVSEDTSAVGVISLSSNWYIGLNERYGTYFNGLIDEVRVYNRALGADEINYLYETDGAKLKINTSRTISFINPTAGLVGWWKLDENPAQDSTSIVDSSGQGNNGTLSTGDGSTNKSTTGQIGQAVGFDGVDDYVDVGNVGNIQTISYWIKSNDQANGGIELNENQYIDDNAIPEGMVDPTLYIDGTVMTLYGPELVDNGDMEAASSWLNDSSVSEARSSEQAHRGAYSWKIVTSYGWNGASQYQAWQLNIGEQYKASAWFYKSSGVDPFLGIGDPSACFIYVTPSISSGSWHYDYNYGISDQQSKLVNLHSNNGATVSYFDDVSLKPVLIGYPITDTNWHQVVITTDTAVNASAVKIGKGGENYLNGSIDDVRVYNRALSPGQVQQLYKWSGVKADPSLVGYWTFNGPDMNWKTNTAYDVSGSDNNGTMINMSTTTSPAVGVSGQALKFDGTNDYVNCGTAPSIDGLNTFSGSAWIYTDSTGFRGDIMDKRSWEAVGKGGWMFLLDTRAGYMQLEIEQQFTGDNSGQWYTPVNSFATGAWYHVAFTYDRSSSANDPQIYINGTLQTLTKNTPSGTSNSDAGIPFMVGVYAGNPSAYVDVFKGKIDEVRYYNRILSASEVTDLYRTGGAGLKINTPGTLSSITPTANLVGWWKLDENPAAHNTSIADSSGNVNTGTLTTGDGSTDKSTSGQIGQAINFDGTNDYIDAGSGSSLDNLSSFTYSAWVKVSGTIPAEGYIVTKWNDSPWGGKQFGIIDFDGDNNDTFWLLIARSGTSAYATAAANSIVAGQWYYLVGTWNDGEAPKLYINGKEATYNGTAPAAGTGTVIDDSSAILSIGARNHTPAATDSYFPGIIDDVRIYNRALSAGEIKNLYQYSGHIGEASLVGNWTFNGPDINWPTNTAYDVSGNVNNGTISGATPAIGVSGQALKFDGSNDYVSTADIDYGTGNQLTVSAWIKYSSCTGANGECYVVEKSTNTGDTPYALTCTSGGNCDFYVNYSAGGNIETTSVNLINNQWHHLAGVLNNTDMTFYVDGVYVGSQATTPISNNELLTIGSDDADPTHRPWNGSIDEVRVYNRALSASEIKQLYNLGRRGLKTKQ